ncbi:MAG: penicillin-binding protein activator [Gammaproteobacteria bacterium]|nr:penicillin-binding protein activator [Gammaproteobacteria bacterium]MDH5728097.1 penicillin-binding protein activator [Gammaproteobacteria bacterium]
MQPRIQPFIILIGIALVLSACADKAVKTASKGVETKKSDAAEVAIREPEGDSLNDALKLEQQGKFLDAAKIYGKHASTALPPLRQQLKLRAANALIAASLPNQARLMLNTIDMERMSAELQRLFALIHAKIALAERDGIASENWLAQITLAEGASNQEKVGLLKMRISSAELSGDSGSALRNRLLLGELLSDVEAIQANQFGILNTLTVLNVDTLDTMSNKTQSPLMQGWIQLAILSVKYKDPIRIARFLGEWRKRFPQHPASEALIASLVPQGETNTLPPRMDKIALLLPFEGPYKRASSAIRDGFLAAYYSRENKDEVVSIEVYNTENDPEQIVAIYQQAVADGATLVVGPLNKQSVEKLAAEIELSVPTLALNHVGSAELFKPNLFQFGLSPENEAEQIADRAWFDGHGKAVLIYPEGSWGERVAAAFKTRWETLGGVLLASETYIAKKNDFSTPLKKLLSIDQSNERYRNITKLLQTRMEYEPRRRQDIDFIFMAAYPRQARLIPPQLKFFNAGDIPVYATSHSYTGSIDRSSDRDMNGVVIGDMPWTLERKEVSNIKKTIYRTWPKDADKLTRLYALGVDAYNVLYYVNWLRSNPNARLAGVTGNLYMNANNQLLRQLSWARFRGGAPGQLSAIPMLSAQ